MRNKNAQGLSINFIVIAAIAALVLVLVIAFTVGGLGGFFKKITSSTATAEKGSDVSTARASCQNLCSQLQQVSGPGAWASANYCTNTEWIDLNKDGQQSADELLNCWDAPISIVCFKDFGQNTYCTEADCDAGCAQPACLMSNAATATSYCGSPCGSNATFFDCTNSTCKALNCTWTNQPDETK